MKQVWIEETPLENAKRKLADDLREVERCEKAVSDAQYFHRNALAIFREQEAEVNRLEAAEKPAQSEG